MADGGKNTEGYVKGSLEQRTPKKGRQLPEPHQKQFLQPPRKGPHHPCFSPAHQDFHTVHIRTDKLLCTLLIPELYHSI